MNENQAAWILEGFDRICNLLAEINDKLPLKPKSSLSACTCPAYEKTHRPGCPEYDPTPWCSSCGAMKRSDCHCGPIADNE